MTALGRSLSFALALGAAAGANACLGDDRPVAINAECNSEACLCHEGFGNCDENPRNGCETDLRLNPEHCGGCGHDCLGGSCSAGSCGPYRVTPPMFSIGGMDTQGDDVYLCDPTAGAILRVGLGDGQVEILLTDQNCASQLAVGTDRLFWGNIVQAEYRDNLWSMALEGSNPQLIDFDSWIRDVDADGDRLVWSAEYIPLEEDTDDEGYERLMTLELGQSAATVVHELQDAEYLTATAVEGDSIYWAVSRSAVLLTTARILRRSPDADQAEQLMMTSGYLVTEIEAVGDDLYWVEEDSSVDVVTQDDAYRVMHLGRTDGAPEILWGDEREISELAADTSGVYWNAGDAIRGLRAGQDEVELLADNQEVSRLIVSERALLWHDYPGKLMALVK